MYARASGRQRGAERREPEALAAAAGAARPRPAELSPEEFRAVFDSSPDGILIVDREGTIQAANRTAGGLFGYSPDELRGQPVEVLVPAAAREAHRRQRAEYAARPHSRAMGSGLLLHGRRRDGTELPVEISLSPVSTGRGSLTIATVRDVTERQRARAFGAQALRATEEERKRIARELHDETLQSLAALLIRLRVATAASAGEPVREMIEELRAELVEAAEGVRRIARDLRPPVLDELGVGPALEEHARGVAEATGFTVEVEAEATDGVLGPDAQLVLYRIVQEALSNAVRHSGGSRVAVRLRRVPDGVVAEIEDDGRGFDPGVVASGEGCGLGLFGMSERAAYVGGRVEVESRPGEGARVRVWLPPAPEPVG